jgi:tripartite-type tricarboxylate transporter receptor subunit TctC
MPKDVLQILSTAFMNALKSESFQKFARENVLIVDTSTPEELARSVEKEWATYRELLKKIKVQ